MRTIDRVPACEDTPPSELDWFPESKAEFAAAVAVCEMCPVRASCLAGAIRRQEYAGVWGGMLLKEGVASPVWRGRGRAPKAVPTAA